MEMEIELTQKQIMYEELCFDAQCAKNNEYNIDEDESMLSFDVVEYFPF